jgi:hypothetical protein
MRESKRRREVAIRLDEEVFVLLARRAAEAERIPEQHASYLVKSALVAPPTERATERADVAA